MSKMSVVGYPRFGKNRELKKLVESYFKKEISEKELIAKGNILKLEQWSFLKKENIDFIPSNDFSYYDNMLDVAFLFNVVPSSFNVVNFSFFDKYFATARGCQFGNIDLKPLKMKKWFNTNYHYIVPEIDDSIDFKLNFDNFFYNYKFALENNIETKPVVIGPFTFLKLSNITTEKYDFSYLLDKLTELYVELIKKCNDNNMKFIQFDEPFLVTDLDLTDIKNLKKSYNKILSYKKNVKFILQTYFGDVRDVYTELISLPFDAIGLDFIEGVKNLELIEKNGFPSDKILFAGIVNGKNIWVNNYNSSIDLLNKLSTKINKQHICLSTSCSLLHVPYTIKKEDFIEDYIKKHFAFAEEKLTELNDLNYLWNKSDYKSDYKFIKNQEIVNSKITTDKFKFADISDKVEEIEKTFFKRNPDFKDRIKFQSKILKLPYLPTTTIGSFPQTSEIRKIRKRFKSGEITYAEYTSFIKNKIKDVIKLQEEIGLDVLVHGEFERNDMVEYFAENLDGFIFTNNGWVQSYGTRGVKPPIIFGDIRRNKQITVEWIKYAQELTNKPVKGILTGPVTILNWSFPREDISLKKIAFQIAIAIKEEVLELEKNNIKIIQVDEAALREKLPLRKQNWRKDYLDWVVKSFKVVHSELKPETQIHTHMCYSEFSDIIEEIKDMDADVITIEAAKSDLKILDTLVEFEYDKQIGPGVYDIHSPRIPSVDEIVLLIRNIINKLGYKNLWVNPDCGLKTRAPEEAIDSLKNMVAAALKVREDLNLCDS